ncbi:MAG: cadherin repeat domain-containing protein [Betaproteobacteria bacterium]|nr:cadherin repeat domain-containing protein [Betaproteobacteria bacterium]
MTCMHGGGRCNGGVEFGGANLLPGGQGRILIRPNDLPSGETTFTVFSEFVNAPYLPSASVPSRSALRLAAAVYTVRVGRPELQVFPQNRTVSFGASGEIAVAQMVLPRGILKESRRFTITAGVPGLTLAAETGAMARIIITDPAALGRGKKTLWVANYNPNINSGQQSTAAFVLDIAAPVFGFSPAAKIRIPQGGAFTVSAALREPAVNAEFELAGFAYREGNSAQIGGKTGIITGRFNAPGTVLLTVRLSPQIAGTLPPEEFPSAVLTVHILPLDEGAYLHMSPFYANVRRGAAAGFVSRAVLRGVLPNAPVRYRLHSGAPPQLEINERSGIIRLTSAFLAETLMRATVVADVLYDRGYAPAATIAFYLNVVLPPFLAEAMPSAVRLAAGITSTVLATVRADDGFGGGGFRYFLGEVSPPVAAVFAVGLHSGAISVSFAPGAVAPGTNVRVHIIAARGGVRRRTVLNLIVAPPAP